MLGTDSDWTDTPFAKSYPAINEDGRIFVSWHRHTEEEWSVHYRGLRQGSELRQLANHRFKACMDAASVHSLGAAVWLSEAYRLAQSPLVPCFHC